MPSSGTPLTENEGLLLALLARAGPLTAYQIAKAYDLSPVSNFNTSKGKIYPMIKRLQKSGLIRGVARKDDARGTERLTCTKAGLKKVKQWVLNIQPAHILPEDGLRSRVQSFDLLNTAEKLEWLTGVREKMAEKLEVLDRYKEMTDTPFQDLVHHNAYSTIQARLAWIDRIHFELSKHRARD
jgi:DNA-binding PadR family transcriptional regulator